MGMGKHSLFASKGRRQSLEHMEILICNSYVLLDWNKKSWSLESFWFASSFHGSHL